MDKCASCHEDKHSTFIHTGMGLSFDTASRSKSSAKFGPNHVVFDTLNDMYYYPYWKSDKLFIREFRLGNKDTTHVLDVEIDYIVGSGQHTNSHLFQTDGYVYQAPITFYVQKDQWDLAPGFEKGNNSRFSRILNSECISCHNSMPALAESSDYKFESIGNGIDCERCHGPGELHVKERLAGEGVNVSNEIDPTIVNPRKLSWERQIDLCQRCHLQGLNVLKEGKTFMDFKPGMKLSETFEIYLPQYEGNQSQFDMANHSQRFQMSQCFIQGNKNELSFTCISCHNPHVSVNMTNTEVYNSACTGCHKEKTCTESEINQQRVKNNCVSCHMPHNGSEDIPHVSVHDHYIRVPTKGKSIDEMQKLVGLYAVNNPSPSKEYHIRAYLEYWEKFDKNPFYLSKAKELLQANSFKRLWLKYYYLNEEYSEAISLRLDEADLNQWELFMLGVCYSKENRKSQSIYFIQKAYTKDKTQRMVGTELLKKYVGNGSLDKALYLGQELEKEFPIDGTIINQIGKIYVLTNKLNLAKPYIDKALKLEPDNMDVWMTHLNFYAKKRIKKNFKYWATKILEKNPKLLDKDDVKVLLDGMS